jgi:hypothetical protein
MQQQQLPSTSAAARVSLACVQCRSRHLRCDAATPTCARCVREGSECTYLKSRRGGRARARFPQRDTSTTSQPLPSGSGEIESGTVLPKNLLPERESVPPLISDQSGSSSSSSFGADDNLGLSPGSNSGSLVQVPLLELYFTFFHPAQPCALPLLFLRQKMNDDVPGMRLLVLVLQFIGSLYSPKVMSADLEDQVKAALAERQPNTNAFEVQALVLYSTAVYWCNEMETARELLDEATRKALALGMNFREFAAENSGGDSVLAESWRRTWWQLYLTDEHLTASNHASFFGTSQRYVLATVELPCEEAEYCSGV